MFFNYGPDKELQWPLGLERARWPIFFILFFGTDIGREHLIEKFKKNFWIIFYLRIHLKGGTRKGTQFDFRRLQRSFQASLPLDSQTYKKCQANRLWEKWEISRFTKANEIWNWIKMLWDLWLSKRKPHLSFFRNNSEVKQVRDKSHFQVIYIVSRCGIEFFKSDLSIQMFPETYKYISVIE